MHYSHAHQSFRFVHLEERTLDEAELPEEHFKGKYERMDAMAAQVKAKEAELSAMDPEQRNAEVARMMKHMVNVSLNNGKPCCNDEEPSSSGAVVVPPGAGPMCARPPAGVAMASASAGDSGEGGATLGGPSGVDRSPMPGGWGIPTSNNMSAEEQMRFFQSLSSAGPLAGR